MPAEFIKVRMQNEIQFMSHGTLSVVHPLATVVRRHRQVNQLPFARDAESLGFLNVLVAVYMERVP